MKNRLIFALIALSWGGSFVAIQYTLHDISPIAAAALRVSIAFGVLLYIRRRAAWNIALQPGDRWRVWLAAFFAQAVPFILLFWGEQSISAGLAGILNGTVPIWTFLLGMCIMPDLEPFTPRRGVGLLLGFGGITLIFAPLLTSGATAASLWGALAVLGMAWSYGIGTILNRSVLSRRAIPLQATLYHQQVACVTYVTLATVLFEVLPGTFRCQPTSASVIALLYLGVCSTALAWIGFYYLIREWGAVRAVAITYLVPLVALVTDLLIFGNRPTTAQLLGAATACSGVLLLQRRS